MPRPDLLALTEDDLVVLSNRGLVRRARQELQSGEPTFELTEDEAGNVTVRWSDDAECCLPAGRVIRDARCNCAAVTICRHLLRSVLAYQQSAAAPTESSEAPPSATDVAPATAPPAGPAEPWDPGTINDEELARHFRPAALQRARASFDEGHLIDLVRSAKPSARIHTLALNLRFLVPGDARYTHCDCAEPAPCRHVPIVVWAFRRLPAEQAGGLVTTREISLPVPTALLDEIETALEELAEAGISGAPSPLIDRFRRLEHRCRAVGLIWPAEIVAELVQQCEAYAGHDARFSPVRVAELVGELCLRCDAIRSDTGAVPQLFVRGASSDRVTEVGSARMVGLGCEARVRRGGVELAAYLQDLDSGTVVAISRDFPDPPADAKEAPRAFWELGRGPALKGISLSALGAGQLLVKGGKRSPGGRFFPGRAEASLQPQSFQWEALRPPVAADDFAEVAARLAALPPASLRPRRVGENVVVCRVARVEAVEFLHGVQAIQAQVRDEEGHTATLLHPYLARSEEGTEAALARLRSQPEELRFVSGRVSLRGSCPVIAPIALIFHNGSTRNMLQPWIDRRGDVDRRATGGSLPVASVPMDPLTAYLGELMEALGELLLLGLQSVDDRGIRLWQDLQRRGSALGFIRFLDPVARLTDAISQRRHSVEWDCRSAASHLLRVTALGQLGLEELRD